MKQTISLIVRNLGRIVLAGSAVFLLGGATKIVPVQFTAIDLVDLKDQPYSTYTRLSSHEPPSRELLKVSFSSKMDLTEFVQQNKYHLIRRASICSDGSFDKMKDLRGDPGVYDKFGLVEAYRTSYDITTKRISPFNYYIYINLRTPWPKQKSEHFVYDIMKNPEDMCIELTGGSASGGPIASNVIRIPRDMVISAVKYSARE